MVSLLSPLLSAISGSVPVLLRSSPASVPHQLSSTGGYNFPKTGDGGSWAVCFVTVSRERSLDACFDSSGGVELHIGRNLLVPGGDSPIRRDSVIP